MTEPTSTLSFEIQLQPGDELSIPADLASRVGPGRWLITIQPATEMQQSNRGHDAFLRGYAVEDEGLYDDQGR